MGRFTDSLKHAWNAFVYGEGEVTRQFGYGDPSYGPPDRRDRPTPFSNEKSIITAILTRIAIDVSAAVIRHARVDDEDRFLEEIDSGLNNCLKVEANIDQGSRAFLQDAAMTMLETGVSALVPVDTTLNPLETGGYDINTMRVGDVVTWHPRHVKVSVYDDRPDKGRREEITLGKDYVSVVYNPLYAVMNAPNSTLQRLIRKLSLLDVVDEQSSSGKLDLIIQLPYTIKSEARRQQANQRRTDIEMQLKGSKYGIAYADGTEKITQLNRPAENNLLKQVEYLVKMLYGQLGITEEVMNGTADEATMLNYNNRTVVPILDALVQGMRRTFLTKTGRSQGQSVVYFIDPFKLVPVSQLADIADKFTRNEILSSNEIRQVVGRKPSKDPNADKLKNSNMPAPSGPANPKQEGDSQNGSNHPGQVQG